MYGQSTVRCSSIHRLSTCVEGHSLRLHRVWLGLHRGDMCGSNRPSLDLARRTVQFVRNRPLPHVVVVVLTLTHRHNLFRSHRTFSQEKDEKIVMHITEENRTAS